MSYYIIHTHSNILFPDSAATIVLSETELIESMHELLALLIDEESLKSYGWPEAPVESVIQSVIRYLYIFGRRSVSQ